MFDKCLPIIKSNKELQNQFKDYLKKQLININLVVKKRKDLDKEYDEFLDLDFIQRLYSEVIDSLTQDEFIELITPSKVEYCGMHLLVVDQEKTFDFIMSKVKNLKMKSSYEEQLKKYVVEKYFNEKSMFIPERYLNEPVKPKLEDYTNLDNDSFIELEMKFTTCNNIWGDVLYNGYCREGSVEWDNALEILFRAHDKVFGGYIGKIVIPYEHESWYDRDEPQIITPVNKGYTSSEWETDLNPLENIDSFIEFIQDSINRAGKYLKKHKEENNIEKLESLEAYLEKERKYIEKLEEIKNTIIDNNLTTYEHVKVYK